MFFNREWRLSVIFIFFLLGSLLTPFCWVLSVNLEGIISPTWKLVQELIWGGSFILLKLQDTLYSLPQERVEEKWTWWWEAIRGLRERRWKHRAAPLDKISSIHSANVCWSPVTMVPDPVLGTGESEIKVMASALKLQKLIFSPPSVWVCSFPPKRFQEDKTESWTFPSDPLDFINHKQKLTKQILQRFVCIFSFLLSSWFFKDV